MPTLIHVVSMQQAAGVEAHFAEFVRLAAARHPDWRHAWLNPARRLHPFFRPALEEALAGSVRLKYRHGVKLPSRPRAIRAWHCRSAFRALKPDATVIWNRSEKLEPVLRAARGRCVHWEHGSAWFGGRERERKAYFERISLAIANSRAAARMLELGWAFTGDVRVCRNALRPSLLPAAPVARRYPRGRPIRLGVAARLSPVKGVPLALHALRELLDRGAPTELHIAGAGPDRETLEALARKLGVADAVRFRGSVRNIRQFYEEIDCLVHLPLTEAFGLVTIEAAAWGVPVIAAAVDGLPEAVADGASGVCLQTELPLDEYVALGGGRDGLPERIYDPAADALAPPRAVAPAAAAAAVERFFAAADTYERASLSASTHVLGRPRFDAHLDDVMAAIAEFHARGGSGAA